MKTGKARLLVYGSLLGVLLPAGIRWGIPELAQSAQRSGLLSSQAIRATTIAIHGNTWRINSPQQPPQTIQLAGLKSIDSTWQNQADSVAVMLIHASQNQVNIQLLNPGSSLAIVRLPNGTLLQQVLLSQGLAEFDFSQKNLPTDIAQTLQQAQQNAQQQHKNLWGLP